MWNPKYKRISGPDFVKLDGKWREVHRLSSPRANGKRWVLAGSHGEYSKYINAPASNPHPLPKFVKKV